ncbi:hypothetical protein BU23DRAFT_274999 [Bimuria novae-zelandiae CBS 107.79]|uniref:Uncharacterized protein n=1 Tax=Bimuria novae-zelandiae CBS 107.79 TaxID=1447943 RepID=A0A6A5VMZ8_9PLEO|nr:hypothetical protein BU23DRAFT_274999 [Bimuria novae-zelandiae CBS 107.79]
MLPRDHALAPSTESPWSHPQFKVTSDPGSDAQTLKHRRRTLQTISELAPQQATSRSLTGTPSRGNNDIPVYDKGGKSWPNPTRSFRRRSFPAQSSTGQRCHASTPKVAINVTVTPKSQFLTRSSKASKSSTRNNPRRRSMPSSFETRGRSLSPVAEGELSRHTTHDDNIQLAKLIPTRSRRRQSDSASQGKEQQEGGWNARREREFIKREQALLEVNAQRQRERLGFNMGSSSVLPSFAPLPNLEANTTASKHSRYYPQPIHNNQPMAADPGRRHSRGRSVRQVNGNIIDGFLFQDGSASQPNAPTKLRRSLSATSDPRWLSHNDRINRTMSPGLRSSSSNSLISCTPTERSPAEPRSSSSLNTFPNSTRSSSMKSSGSAAYSAMRPSQRSSFTYTRGVGHPLRQNPVESLPVRADVKPEHVVSPPPSTHVFLQSPYTAQALYSRTVPPVQSSIAPSTSHIPHNLSRPPSRSQQTPSAAHMQKTLAVTDVIYRENPDKRGLPTRGLSKEKKDEAQRRARREKVKERVRRANMLEEEREKELVEVDKAKKRSRGLLCGLFSRV